uniref:Uncharacterized protein n=1 Tax=Phytophthora ramorum TaxID=164328 RepID=H3H7T1_PHYRM
MARTLAKVSASKKSRGGRNKRAKKIAQNETENAVYEIYGGRYGPARATRDGDYLTTKATWHVARIVDRRDTERGQEYQIFWLNQSKQRRKCYIRSWEPRKVLLEDGFDDEVGLIDRWKAAANVKDLESFCHGDEFGERLLAASTAGTCVFEAFKKAAELAGRPDIVTDADIADFIAETKDKFHKDLTQGTSWKVFKVFLRKLRDDRRDFIYRAIEKDNFAIAGRRGARVLNEVDLCDGLYLVAAYNHTFVGHCIVLKVEGNKRTIYNDDDGKPVSSAEDWINFISFIRPFIVFEPRK